MPKIYWKKAIGVLACLVLLCGLVVAMPCAGQGGGAGGQALHHPAHQRRALRVDTVRPGQRLPGLSHHGRLLPHRPRDRAHQDREGSRGRAGADAVRGRLLPGHPLRLAGVPAQRPCRTLAAAGHGLRRRRPGQPRVRHGVGLPGDRCSTRPRPTA